MSGMIKMQRQIDNIQKEVVTSSAKIVKIENGEFTPQMNDAVVKLVEADGLTYRDEMHKDFLEIEKRRSNAIVFNLAESNNVNGEARKEFDKEALDDLLYNKLKVPKNVEPKAFFRLGKKESNDARGSKPRPVKLIFPHDWEKQELINRFVECKKQSYDLGNVHI